MLALHVSCGKKDKSLTGMTEHDSLKFSNKVLADWMA
jgi:hypothetical protein